MSQNQDNAAKSSREKLADALLDVCHNVPVHHVEALIGEMNEAKSIQKALLGIQMAADLKLSLLNGAVIKSLANIASLAIEGDPTEQDIEHVKALAHLGEYLELIGRVNEGEWLDRFNEIR